jgi:hypothetical protein
MVSHTHYLGESHNVCNMIHYLWLCTRGPAFLFVDGGRQANREAIQRRYRRYLVHRVYVSAIKLTWVPFLIFPVNVFAQILIPLAIKSNPSMVCAAFQQ